MFERPHLYFFNVESTICVAVQQGNMYTRPPRRSTLDLLELVLLLPPRRAINERVS